MSVQGAMQLGLIGWGIQYSLSPLIHETAGRLLGLTISYRLHDIDSANKVRQFLKEAWDGGAHGFNVTQPWKLLSGAAPVNTLYRQAGGKEWSGTSTDGEGFLRGLTRIGCRPLAIDRMIFLGAGAVVNSLVESVARERGVPPEIHCICRNQNKTRLPANWTVHPWHPASLAKLLADGHPGTILVQATPLPLLGDTMAGFAVVLEHHRQGAGLHVVDLCYGRRSQLVDVADRLGIGTQDGLPMLIEQARSAQQIWWGQSAPYESLKEACLTALRQRG